MGDVDEARLSAVERGHAVHEAVCAERYKGINFKLNVILIGVGIILTAIAMGDPLILFLRGVLAGR